MSKILKKSNNKVIIFTAFSMIVLAFSVYSGQVFSAANAVDDNVEIISQIINKADINHDLQNIKEEKNSKDDSQKDKVRNSVSDHKRIAFKKSNKSLQSSSNTLNVQISDNTKNKEIKLSRINSQKDSKIFTVSLPNTNESITARMTNDGSAVYRGNQQSTDIVAQSFDDSARILTVLKGIDSATEYAYNINLPIGSTINKSDDGGIIVFDNQGAFIGGFAAPWAIDSQGNKIPTRYEIRGSSVVQIIDHISSNTSYPVVADPWMYINLISSASWEYKSSGWRLLVTPTLWARVNGGSALPYYVGLAGWDELYSKYKDSGRGIKYNLGGMKDQYVCHQQFAFYKSTWNLDEWRPDVSYYNTVMALCNP